MAKPRRATEPGPGPRRLRIALFTNTFVPLTTDGAIASGADFGGVDYGSWALCQALARQGHDVHVVTTHREGMDRVRAPWTLHPVKATFRVAQTPLAIPMLWRPHRQLPEVDVVLARMGNQPAPLAALRMARRRRVPFVVSYHGDWTGGYGSLLRRMGVAAQNGVLAGHVLRHADTVIALSAELRKTSRHLQRVVGKTVVVPNGVDPGLLQVHEAARSVRDRLGVGRHGRLVATMGTLNPIKGLDVLLDAWPEVLRRVPGSRLVVLGDGPHREAYARQADRLGIAESIVFLGFLHDGKADVLAAADAFCLPSRSEAFPNAVVEAAWLGRPIVASRLPVLQGLVQEGVSARLVPPEDPASLAAALVDVLQDAGLAKRLGAAARDWARGLSWDEVAARQADVLRGAIARHESSGPSTRHPGGP